MAQAVTARGVSTLEGPDRWLDWEIQFQSAAEQYNLERVKDSADLIVKPTMPDESLIQGRRSGTGRNSHMVTTSETDFGLRFRVYQERLRQYDMQ